MKKSLQERKAAKINVRMSQFLKTRTANQCRSHHQKMLKHYGTIEAIIQEINEKNEEKSEAEDEKTMKDDAKTLPSPTVELREVQDF